MVGQRHKDPGRRGRPKARGGKTRHARPKAGRSTVRPRRARGVVRPLEVIPSERWRPMRRVAGVSWEQQHHGEPRRVRIESEDQEWPRHGSRLVEFEEARGQDARAAKEAEAAAEEWQVAEPESDEAADEGSRSG